MEERASVLGLTLTLAPLLVVCTLLSWSSLLVTADECGTRFTDPTSSAVLAQVVLQGSIKELFPTLPNARTRSANVTVGKVYKGMDIVKNVGMDGGSVIMVGQFGQEDKDNCVVSMEATARDPSHIFFLRQTSIRNLLQMSALPLTLEDSVDRRVKRSLCDTCVRPPRIKKLRCKDCTRKPTIKNMRPQTVKLGRRARLRCKAKANPTPSFSWFKNGIPIRSGAGSIVVKTKASSSTLYIPKTTGAHNGQYKCVASNEVGTSEVFFTLTVIHATSSYLIACSDNPCMNGGTCYYEARENVKLCHCLMKFEGVHCERPHKSRSTSQSRSTDRGRNANRERNGTWSDETENSKPRGGENLNNNSLQLSATTRPATSTPAASHADGVRQKLLTSTPTQTTSEARSNPQSRPRTENRDDARNLPEAGLQRNRTATSVPRPSTTFTFNVHVVDLTTSGRQTDALNYTHAMSNHGESLIRNTGTEERGRYNTFASSNPLPGRANGNVQDSVLPVLRTDAKIGGQAIPATDSEDDNLNRELPDGETFGRELTEEDLDSNVGDIEGLDSIRPATSDRGVIASRLKKSRLKTSRCPEKHYCKNGGSCIYVHKLKTKYCQCASGFAGKQCEVEV